MWCERKIYEELFHGCSSGRRKRRISTNRIHLCAGSALPASPSGMESQCGWVPVTPYPGTVCFRHSHSHHPA